MFELLYFKVLTAKTSKGRKRLSGAKISVYLSVMSVQKKKKAHNIYTPWVHG